MDLRDLHRDERGLVVSWLLRILLAVALAGVVLFDAAALVVNYFSVNDTATEVANAVAADLATGSQSIPNHECQRQSHIPACRAAYEIAREKGVRVVSAHFDQRSVFHVEIRKTASTLIVRRIPAIEDWGRATASADADTN